MHFYAVVSLVFVTGADSVPCGLGTDILNTIYIRGYWF
jgi:hypothetical protein